MRVALGLAANDVLFPVVGFAFLYLLGLAASFGNGLRLLGLSYLTGWALLGTALSIGLMLGLPLTILSVVAVAAALVAGCVLAGRHRHTPPPVDPAPVAGAALNRWITRIGAALLGVGVLAAMITAARGEWNPTSDYDALWFWLPKAATIYYAHGLDPQLWHAIAHLEYPPLMPAMTAATFAFTGGFHPSLIPFQQALLGAAFVVGAFALLDRFVPRWLSIPGLALLGTAPWFWAKLESPMPDQTLAYLIAAAMLTSAIWLCEPRTAWLGLAVVFLAAASLIKLEGVLFGTALAVVVLGAGLARYRRAGARAGILLLGPGAILLWHAWLGWHGLRGSSPDYDLAKLADPGFSRGGPHVCTTRFTRWREREIGYSSTPCRSGAWARSAASRRRPWSSASALSCSSPADGPPPSRPRSGSGSCSPWPAWPPSTGSGIRRSSPMSR